MKRQCRRQQKVCRQRSLKEVQIHVLRSMERQSLALAPLGRS